MALTATKVPKSKGIVGGHEQIEDSAITEDGSTIALARNTDVTGDLDVSSTIKGAAGMTLAGTIVGVTTAITGTKNNALAISVPNQTADAAGVGISIVADAGAVGARNGGSITLTPGAASGAGTAGSVVINGLWTAAGKTCANLGTVSAATAITVTTLTTDLRNLGVAVKTTTYPIEATDDIVVCNSTAGFTVTLPAASASGRRIQVKNINTGIIEIAGDATDTIDGIDSNVVLGQYGSVILIDYVATGWAIIY
jgi:hypothetical protein